jgi:organic hydroperoxide reductase OsmC/OhrA
LSREHHYHLALFWTGAQHLATTSYLTYSREYLVEVEGKPPLRGSADPLFLGDPNLLNPEDLLVAALSSCHMLSFLAEAVRAGVVVSAYEDSAEGTMVFEDGGGQFTSVVLHPRVTVSVGCNPALVERLHAQAHANCFIARSVNFPVRHEATLAFAEP